MEAALAQPPNHQLTSHIPHEVYRPLLEIARQGYDANDILQWYTTMKNDLCQNDLTNATATYSLTPPFSVCSPAPHEPQAAFITSDNVSPIEAVVQPQNLYETPITNWNLWPEAFSFQSPEPNPLNVATSASFAAFQINTSSAEYQSNITQLASPWSPTTPIFPNYNVSEHSAIGNEASSPGNNISSSIQWLNHSPPNSINDASKKRRASQPMPYYTAISSTAMPLLVPSSPQQPRGALFVPGTSSTEVTYLPPISIIPSRKRRKTLSKGVKKFIQPLHLQRQSFA